MCFVESKSALKPVISCAVSLKSYLQGEIFTESPLIYKSRENILEFLLLNHPIDCTICDQAGECDLQDHSLVHGVGNKRFYSYKRKVDDKYVGPVVITAMTRCIHCTRCVRFGSEIAGLKEFGIFGRGVYSEVGIYKPNGLLTSELSGNLIDLCPVGSFTKGFSCVKKQDTHLSTAIKACNNNDFLILVLNGALTGRPYPYTIRVWEHVFKNTIDCTDAFGQLLRAGVAYNKVRRLLPNLYENEEDTPWINDRTRFSFEGLPSGNSVKTALLKNKKKKKVRRKKLSELIVFLFYFYDHLKTHLFKVGSFIFVFGTTVSLELISLMLFTFYKYSFIKIKTSEVLPQNNDLESNFQLNTSTSNLENLLRSDLCLLVGVNSRYEGSYLNLKLRKRYLKSNFNIISLSSLLDLSFPTFLLGSTLKLFNSIIEGNGLISQTFKNANYPIVILNSEYFRRFDSKSLNIVIEILKSYTCFAIRDWNGLNVLNSSLNDVGTNSLNRFSVVTHSDLVNYSSLYFFNSPLYIFSVKKFLELRVLNLLGVSLKAAKKIPKAIFHQSAGIENSSWLTKRLEQNDYIRSYFYRPTANFYNKNETYINAEGLIKKSVSIVISSFNLKSDWPFLRKIYRYTKRIMFTKDMKNKKQISILRTKRSHKIIQKYLALQLCPIKVFTRLIFREFTERKPFIARTCTFFFLLCKYFNTKIKFWLRDFYLGNRDLYSRHSRTMVQCSAYVRCGKLNF